MEDYDNFIALHKPQLESSAVPQHLWPSVHRKVTAEVFDAGEALQLMLFEYDDDAGNDETTESATASSSTAAIRPVFALSVARASGIKANDPNAIFLVDHAWTFRIYTARQQLEQYEQLADRLCTITGIDLEDPQRIDKILQRIWKYGQVYSIASEGMTPEERVPIWYIMDEVGSAVNHSDTPNFRLVPFLHLTKQVTYSLLFPIRDCANEEQVTRDFVEYVSRDAPERDALLLPWRDVDLKSHSFMQTEPDAEYFMSGHIPETYTKETQAAPQINRNESLKVYSEYQVLNDNLTAAGFEFVDNPLDADILWLMHHFKNFAELARETPNKFINQFPFEYVITIKDLLSIVCRRAAIEHHNADTLETYPSWLPTTYNLKTELLQFVSYYQHREGKNLDNHWIIKPWNLARGLDTHITRDIAHIVRLPVTGPKIVQKYIEHPVLFQREDLNAMVKFDIRYVILLKSVDPLEAYVYRKFFLRFANQTFSLDHYDNYEKHFTVMNYQENAELCHIQCDNFIRLWQEQYPKYDWSGVEDDICRMLHEMLVCATTKSKPPCAMAPCAQSRALYAADVMLEWCNAGERIQPKLLEVNWMPDCKRACDYYPEFYNDIFKLLFLNESYDDSFRLLCA